MASRTLATIISLKDQFTTPAKKIAKNTKNINREFKRTTNQIKKMARSIKNQFKRIAKYSLIAAVAIVGAFAKQSVNVAKGQIEAETKLVAVMKNTKGMTDKNIESIKKYAGVLQTQGIISDEVTLSGTQQLATYQLQASTLKKLMPGMQDLIAQQKGMNATTNDAVNFGNMLGKVMTGQVVALSRAGINFTKAQEQILKYGTESEKAATLAEVLKANVGGVNKALSQTDEGQIEQMKNNFSGIQKLVGMKILPLMSKFARWFNEKIPAIRTYILKTIDTFSKFYNKVKPYFIIIKEVIYKLLKSTEKLVNFTVNNFDTIAPVILTVVTAMTAYKTIMLAQMAFTKLFVISEFIKNAVLATGASTVNAITIAQWAWNMAMNANPIGVVITLITLFVGALIIAYKRCETFRNIVNKVWEAIKKLWDIFNPIDFIIEKIQKLKDKVLNFLEPLKKAGKWIQKIFNKEKDRKLTIKSTESKLIETKEKKDKSKASAPIKQYAKGGIATKASIFGEAGPEIAIPLEKSQNSKVLLNQATNIINPEATRISQDRTQNININIDTFYGLKDFKEKIAQALYEISKQSGNVVI